MFTPTAPVAPSGVANSISKFRFGANASQSSLVMFDKFASVYVRGAGNCDAHVPVCPHGDTVIETCEYAPEFQQDRMTQGMSGS